MNVFGKRSEENLSEVKEDLELILRLGLKRSKVDFGIYEGSRSVETQRTHFKNGASSIDPDSYPSLEALCSKAKHIVIEGHEYYDKSRAVDILVAEKYNGKNLTFDYIHLSYIAGVLMSVSEELYEQGLVVHKIRWGGDWDGDGIIALDHKLKDLVHIELVKV